MRKTEGFTRRRGDAEDTEPNATRTTPRGWTDLHQCSDAAVPSLLFAAAPAAPGGGGGGRREPPESIAPAKGCTQVQHMRLAYQLVLGSSAAIVLVMSIYGVTTLGHRQQMLGDALVRETEMLAQSMQIVARRAVRNAQGGRLG